MWAAVTGANGELGTGIIQSLIKQFTPIDLKIFLLCRSHEKAKELKDRLIAIDNCRLFYVACDLNCSRSVSACANAIKDELKGEALDFLFLNAGIMPTEGFNLILGLKNLVLRFESRFAHF
jgi:NAD(P)-dependent dehydrogenase (short-subunit alcohol dehydrogenase family)